MALLIPLASLTLMVLAQIANSLRCHTTRMTSNDSMTSDCDLFGSRYCWKIAKGRRVMRGCDPMNMLCCKIGNGCSDIDGQSGVLCCCNTHQCNGGAIEREHRGSCIAVVFVLAVIAFW